MKRTGPDTTLAKRLQRIGHSNVLVDCFMRVLAGRVPENIAGNTEGGRELAVSKALQWNTGREVQKVRWKEVESRRMGYVNLQWRRKPIANGPVRKAPSSLLTMAVSPGTIALVACDLLHSLGIGQ